MARMSCSLHELRYFRLQRLVLAHLSLEKAHRNLGFFRNTPRRKNVHVRSFVPAVAKAIGFKNAFLNQRFNTEIGRAKTDPQFARQITLAYRGRFLNQSKDPVVDFVRKYGHENHVFTM